MDLVHAGFHFGPIFDLLSMFEPVLPSDMTAFLALVDHLAIRTYLEFMLGLGQALPAVAQSGVLGGH